MSHTDLPATLDPYKLTEQGAVVKGSLKLEALGRFSPLVWNRSGAVDVQIAFSKDQENRRLARGTVRVDLQLQCQRCMELMDYELVSDFELAFVVGDEQARNLPRDLEPLEVEGRGFNLWQAVEDELLLSLPPFPAHADENCIARLEAAKVLEAPEAGESRKDESRQKPFEALGALKPALRQNNTGESDDRS